MNWSYSAETTNASIFRNILSPMEDSQSPSRIGNIDMGLVLLRRLQQ